MLDFIKNTLRFLFALSVAISSAQTVDPVLKKDSLTKHTKFYNNGQKMIEYYQNSLRQKDSVEHTWYGNGQLKSQIFYKNNAFFGKFKEWYNDGTLKFSGTRIKNNREGQCSEYYPNGQEKYHATFFQDYPIGKTIQRYSNGNKKNQTNLRAIKNNEYIPKHHTRIVANKIDTTTFIQVGRVIHWYENGYKEDQKYYSKKGIQDFNKNKRWYKNGKLKRKGDFKQKKGLFKEWYENGQLSLRCRNKNNLLHGLSKFWHRNGQISSIQNRKKGVLIESKSWNEQGILIGQIIKTDSTIVSKKWNSQGKLIEHKK